MRLEFQAEEGGFYTPEDRGIYCLLCALGGRSSKGQKHDIVFQRATEDDDPRDDNGVHFCYDDQINGDYDCVRTCRLSRTAIQVELHPLTDRRKRFSSVFVDISKLTDSQYDALRQGLPRIFRGTEGILEIQE